MKRTSSSADERDAKKPNTTPAMTVEREYKEVRTNYWPLELYTNKTIFKYHFEFADGKVITERDQLNKIFRLAFDAMGLTPKDPKAEKPRRFVWGNSLFTLTSLPQQYLKVPLEISEKDSAQNTTVLCSIIISGPDAFNLDADVKGMQRVFRRGAEGQEYEMVTRKEGAFIAQVINILFKPILIKQMNLTPMGRRGFFNVSASEGNDRNYWFMPGFNPVVVLHNNRLFLHTDFSYRAIAKDNSLRFVSNKGNNMGGQSVYCEHNRRHYIVSGVKHDMTPLSTFKLKDGTVTSYAEYYQKRYGLRVRDTHQPLLEVTQRRKQGTESIFLIPEFCKVAGIPSAELSGVRLPMTSTAERYQKLSTFIKDFVAGASTSKFTTVKTSTTFFDPQAKLLRPQDIKFNTKNFRLTDKHAWDQQLRNDSGNKLLSVPPDFKWEIWYSAGTETAARSFYDTLKTVTVPLCPKPLAPPTWVKEDVQNIRYAVSKTKPAVVLVVLPSAEAKPYNQVKNDLLLAGVPGQVVVVDKFMKGNRADMSKVTKAGLQLLAKAGAVPWSTTFAANDPLSNKLAALHTCVFGIERSINKRSSETMKMAVTCTVDRDRTAFSEYFNYHVGEKSNSMPSLQSVIARGLEAFRKNTGAFPGRLVLYSSGASEGALQQIVANDIKEVNSAIADLYKGTRPEVMFVLACRSGTTRLFVAENGVASNVKPGTVVDRNICNSNEFYLVSHDGGQKSVMPLKYILAHHEVAEDKRQVSLTIKDLQRFSFALCHLYYNWPGPISCPAPLKYADKLAKLAAAAGLPSRPDEALATKLFYI